MEKFHIKCQIFLNTDKINSETTQIILSATVAE